MYTDTERILSYWRMRPCWICAERGVEERGVCPHRELEVAQAELEREDLRLARRLRKPAEVETTKIRRVK